MAMTHTPFTEQIQKLAFLIDSDIEAAEELNPATHHANWRLDQPINCRDKYPVADHQALTEQHAKKLADVRTKQQLLNVAETLIQNASPQQRDYVEATDKLMAEAYATFNSLNPKGTAEPVNPADAEFMAVVDAYNRGEPLTADPLPCLLQAITSATNAITQTAVAGIPLGSSLPTYLITEANLSAHCLALLRGVLATFHRLLTDPRTTWSAQLTAETRKAIERGDLLAHITATVRDLRAIHLHLTVQKHAYQEVQRLCANETGLLHIAQVIACAPVIYWEHSGMFDTIADAELTIRTRQIKAACGASGRGAAQSPVKGLSLNTLDD
jgi:hypothetical protein